MTSHDVLLKSFSRRNAQLSALLTSTVALGMMGVTAPACAQAKQNNAAPTQQIVNVALPDHDNFKTAEPEALWKLSVGGLTSLRYSDNLYKAGNNKTSDMFATVAPTLALSSDLDAHAFKATGNIEATKYLKEQDNDYVDGGFTTNARFDLGAITALHIDSDYQKDHIAIGSFEDDPNDRTTEPTPYTHGTLSTKLAVRPTNYLYEIGVKATAYDFDNVMRTNGTTNINDDRDRREYNPWIRTGIYTNTNTLLYIKADMMKYHYDSKIDSTALHERDSDGKALALGLELGSQTGIRWLDMNVGYLARSFDDTFYDDVSTVGADAQGHWQLTPHWKLAANASRTIEESTLAATSSYIQSRIGGSLTYKLTQAWDVTGNARYTQNDFQDNGTSALGNRQDDVYDVGVGVNYAITPVYQANFGINHIKRSSNQKSVEYDANNALVSISAKLN